VKIASNTPASFYPKNGYDFVQLGEGLDDVTIIVLMLEKNWGSGSIDKIKALTYWLSLYPKEIPCFLVGCESTIPNSSVERYCHDERDSAIRDLCDEVLRRSASIGVRGEITYLYLTKILKYNKNQVDIIYQSGDSNNIDRLGYFLHKNNCPQEISRSVLSFQAAPRVFYERPLSFDKIITISRPYISILGESARLCSKIAIDGSIKILWCETSSIYRQFLLVERSDAFLSAILPLAMRSGKDVFCEAPVSEQFLHNLNEVLIPQLCSYDPRLYRTKIIAAGDSSLLISGNSVATGLSCGVDSLYTVGLYTNSGFKSMNLTHLYCGNYLYGNDGQVYERAELAAHDFGLPLVRTATNINEALGLPHLYTHFFKTMFGVLSLRKLFRIYYYSTGEDFSHFNLRDNSIRDTAEIELLLLYVFSCADFQVVTGGAKSERLEKTRAICSLSTAHKFLNVCLYPEKKINCGKCGKCMRTLLMLDMLNSLDLFCEVFDIVEYRENRINSFVYLIREKNSIMLSDVYKYFLKTEPELIRQAEGIVFEGAN
jgi:hypothetical protein